SAILGGALMIASPASAQKPTPAKPSTTMSPPPAAAPQATAPAQPQSRTVIIEPVRVYDPFFDYPYPYAYEPDYMASNFGYVKIKMKTENKDAQVYVDGGFADKIDKAKKFALKPGTHDIELRDSDGRTLYREKVAVTVGKTTDVNIGE